MDSTGDIVMEDAERDRKDHEKRSNPGIDATIMENQSSEKTNNDENTDADPIEEEEDAKRTIEMLQGEDISDRVAAASRLESVAKALGPRRTREELLPFITESVDDEDEVLIALSSSLGKLVSHIGGSTYAHTLLPPIEFLLTVEERSVRDNAIESVKNIISLSTVETFNNQYAAMISRLATKEWFTARISACTLIAASLELLPPDNQETEILHFAQLCRDDVPMVRRAASQNLGTLLKNVVNIYGISALVKDGIVASTLLPLYEELSINDQDSVRLQTSENCIAFGKAVSSVTDESSGGSMEEKSQLLDEIGASMLVERILPLVVATIDDRSWRVRWTAASKFAEVVKSFVKLTGALDSLIPAYEKLLQDPEAEVRTAATFNLAEVTKCNSVITIKTSENQSETNSIENETETFTTTVAQRLVKRVSVLTEDESDHVRAALAMVATQLAPALGKEDTIIHLVPPVLLLLRDSAPEVRLNIISSLAGLNEIVEIDLLSQSLLPAIKDLAEDSKWRIRLAIIQSIPLLADQLGREFFSDELSSLCVGWLQDDIASIRKAAATNLKDLTALFGAEWATIHLIPSTVEITRDSLYLLRLTALQALTLMCTVMDPDVVRVEVLPIVLDMARDSVPNIRFNVAKGLETISPICGNSTYDAQVRPVLSVLREDTDRDVRYFSRKAMEAVGNQLQRGDESVDMAPMSKI